MGADRCGGFLYTSCAPRLHRKSFRTASRFPIPTTPEQPEFCTVKLCLTDANSLSFVAYNPQNPPVLLPPKSVCLAWDSPFPAVITPLRGGAKGITH